MVIVVFRSRIREDADLSGIEAGGARMYQLASAMPGFISYKEFTAEDGETAAIVEFETEPQVLAWKAHPEHVEIQEAGRARVFESYDITVAAPSRRYGFDRRRGRFSII
jgi:heme-degrading monooxygenase HmoA